ncbi:hypothetical protein [Pontibacter actiniarum]|uniref:hypothetical protein n=1 Tax=Pontibacter actiniarum TaxID=323450 RepID=UPI000417C1B1|nr:hypothetical protein [Pontibacter actiniarum]
MSTKYLPIGKYAKEAGVTRQAIYLRIERGILDAVIIPDASGEERKYIDIEKHPPKRLK